MVNFLHAVYIIYTGCIKKVIELGVLWGARYFTYCTEIVSYVDCLSWQVNDLWNILFMFASLILASLRSRDADVDDAVKMVAVPMYGHATPFWRHFHVVFDVRVIDLKLANAERPTWTYAILTGYFHLIRICSILVQISPTWWQSRVKSQAVRLWMRPSTPKFDYFFLVFLHKWT